MSQRPEQLHFTVSSYLKSVIGQDLITDDFVAVFELVKNAYDAGASTVDVEFSDEKITISDDGKGMSFTDIRDKWLFVAYSAKSDGSEDDDGFKPYAGSKGVGRFSSDRLGEQLTIFTRKTGENHVNRLEVNWTEFEESSKKHFVNIPVRYKELNASEVPSDIIKDKHGTTIIISRVRASWDDAKLIKLKRELAKLINPFSDQSNFIINLFAPKYNQQDEERLNSDPDLRDSFDPKRGVINGPITNFVFKTLTEKTTRISVHLVEGKWLDTELVDRGEVVFRIREEMPFNTLKASDFSCNIYYLNRAAKHTFKLRVGIDSVSFGSLFLFRNGFRVYPIGEATDDTWGLDRRKQQGQARYLGTRDIIGRVDVTGSERDFREVSSRNGGLIETAAVLDLHECVWQYSIKRLEKYVVGVTWADKLEKDTPDTSRVLGESGRSRVIEVVSKIIGAKNIEIKYYSPKFFDILDQKAEEFRPSLSSLRKLAEKSSDIDLLNRIEKASAQFEEMRKAEADALEYAEKSEKAFRDSERQKKEVIEKSRKLEEKVKFSEQENLFLRSLSTEDEERLLSFHHDIRICSSTISAYIKRIRKKVSRPEGIDKKDLLDWIEKIESVSNKISTITKIATKANFALESQFIEADLVRYLHQYLSEVCSAFSGDGMIVTVENEAGEFRTSFKPIEIGMICDNVINNSKKAGARNVVVHIMLSGSNQLVVRFSDDGSGVQEFDAENLDSVFNKGVTTRSGGSGLGLYNVKRIMEDFGGAVEVEKGINNEFQLALRFLK